MRLIALALLLAAPAAAQDIDPAPWRAEFLTCIQNADTGQLQTCRGTVAERCSDQTEGGWSNLGMTACIRAEGRLWDDVLNADWPRIRAWAEAADTAEAAHFGDQYSNRAESLLAAQRAWIAFRDAECDLAYARWGSGSMRYPTHAACITDLTAERVIALRALTEDF